MFDVDGGEFGAAASEGESEENECAIAEPHGFSQIVALDLWGVRSIDEGSEQVIDGWIDASGLASFAQLLQCVFDDFADAWVVGGVEHQVVRRPAEVGFEYGSSDRRDSRAESVRWLGGIFAFGDVEADRDWVERIEIAKVAERFVVPAEISVCSFAGRFDVGSLELECPLGEFGGFARDVFRGRGDDRRGR